MVSGVKAFTASTARRVSDAGLHFRLMVLRVVIQAQLQQVSVLGGVVLWMVCFLSLD